MAPTILQPILEKLLQHAASAAHLVGHLNDNGQADLIRQIAEEVDTVAHGLTELLGEARALAKHDTAVAPNLAHDSTPMLTSSTGEVR